eukprot:gene6183-7698_t
MLKVGSNNQIVNHFSNFNEIGSKKGLTTNLNNLYHYNKNLRSTISSFFPRSYDISNNTQRDLFIQDFNRKSKKLYSLSNHELNLEQSSSGDIQYHTTHSVQQQQPGVNSPFDPQPIIDGDKNIWIAKPSFQARGVGISVFDDIQSLFEFTKKENDDYIVQKYIEKPYTIHKRKFDIRQFVLVKSLNPLVIFLFKDCYLRFCSIDYSTDNLSDRYAHLSNHQVQKEYIHSDTHIPNDVDLLFPDNQWSLKTFKKYLSKEYGKNVWEESISKKIKQLVITTIESWPKEGHRKNSFELLGFDILLDDQLNPHLLEVNTNPGLHLLTDVVKVHHKNAVDDLFKVVIDNQVFWDTNNLEWIKNLTPKLKNEYFGQWDPIYVGKFNDKIKPIEVKKENRMFQIKTTKVN